MKKLAIFIFVAILFGCNDEGPKENSNLSELLEMNLEATSGFTPDKTFIDTATNQVLVFVSSELAELNFPLTLTPEMSISPGATVVPSSGSTITFNDPEDFVLFKVTAENGLNYKEYTLFIRDKQLPNAGFENWFTETGMNGQPFSQPGKYAESTVWATANMGTSIYSIYGTSPVQDGNNTLIKIETVETVALPVVAGALYIGKFDLDAAIQEPTNPVAAAILGIPFFGKPKAVQFKYSYKGGEQLVQAELKDPGNLFGGFNLYELEGKDKLGIEVALEKRVGDEVTVIAKANFQSNEDTGESLKTLQIPLQYYSNEEPSHFYISFSPSFDGGDFIGAIGSTLIIDDVELIYE